MQHTNIVSDNALLPVQCQAIIWTNAATLSIRPQGKYLSETLFKIQKFWVKEMYLNMPSAKWRPFCLGLNVLKTSKSQAKCHILLWSLSYDWSLFVPRLATVHWMTLPHLMMPTILYNTHCITAIKDTIFDRGWKVDLPLYLFFLLMMSSLSYYKKVLHKEFTPRCLSRYGLQSWSCNYFLWEAVKHQ